MKKLLYPLALVFLVGFVLGCHSETQTVAAPVGPKKGTFNQAIQNNPNMPDAAKKALLNGQNGK